MKTFQLVILLTGFLFFSACKTQQEFPFAEKQALDIQKAGETPGMAVSVSKDGNIIWSKGFGVGHLEQQVPVYPDKTKFRIGSISKALTSAAVGILVDEGKLDLDAPVQQYVSSFPEKRYPITVRQLAGHLAGIRHYWGEEFLSVKRYHTVKEGLEIFMHDTLLFEPGTKYSYTSYGFNLLSAVVEGASGQDFLTYMEQKVFEPLGMKNTIADLNDTIIHYRSGFYSMNQGRVVNAPLVDNSYKWAGGGYLSTSEDLVHFGNAMLSNMLFPKEIVDELIKSQKTKDGKETGYGIGWSSGVNKYNRKFYGHGGGSIGGSCNLLIFPDKKLVIAAVTNDSRSSVGQDLHKLAELFLQE